MPISTSPLVAYAPNDTARSDRLQNVFRLPLDDTIQADSVAYFVIRVLHAKNAALLIDASPNAAEYSDTFYNLIPPGLGAALQATPTRVTDPQVQLHAIALDLLAQKRDVVILAGYAQTAHYLLSAMSTAVSGPPSRPRPWPTIVLTDGCMDSTLPTFGFDVFVTFPAPPPNPSLADGPKLTALLQGLSDPSYELFGYDAVRILDQALNACDGDISRRRLTDALRAQRVPGLTASYHFDPYGEPEFGSYYLYKPTSPTRLSRLTTAFTLSREELARWKDSRERLSH